MAMGVKVYKNGAWEEKGGLQGFEFKHYTSNEIKKELILGLENCEFSSGTIYVCKDIISTGFINVRPSSQLIANSAHRLIQLNPDYFKTTGKDLYGIVVAEYSNSTYALCSNASVGKYYDGYWITISPSIAISTEKTITFQMICLVV